jgi:hypothetical protein
MAKPGSKATNTTTVSLERQPDHDRLHKEITFLKSRLDRSNFKTSKVAELYVFKNNTIIYFKVVFFFFRIHPGYLGNSDSFMLLLSQQYFHLF